MKNIFSLSLLLLLATTARANYCNWDGCDGRPQGCCDDNALSYCNGNEDQCESGCGSGAQWCSNSFSYCTWSTCDGVIRSTEFCNASAENCANNCNGMWCTNGGGSGGDPGSPTPAPMEGSTTPAPFSFSTGTATTTRYWDCSGGACGCGYGDSGKPAHCYSNAMFSAPANNVHGATFYGTAAVSQVLFGEGSWLGSGCGTCYKLTGTSNVGQGGVDTTIVLKAANLCPGNSNPSCSGDKIHFDIAAPGFDFTASSASNTCNDGREPIEKDAFGECEFWPSQSCDCGVFQDEVLEAGCNNFKSLNWNNPTVTYEAVACPVELERLSCWEENGGSWPFNPPEFCATNVHTSSSTPSPVAPGPTPSPVTPGPTPSPVTPGPTPSPVTPGPTPPAGTTQSPVTPGPTPAPATPGPTLSPVTPGPTPTPVTPWPTPSPTKAPSSLGGGGKSCCSQNLRDCDVSGWCASKRNRCEGNCNHFWIPDDKSCEIPLYGECTNNLNGCCSPAICQGDNANYKQCLL